MVLMSVVVVDKKTPIVNMLSDAQFKRVLVMTCITFRELLLHLLTSQSHRKLSTESQLTLNLAYWQHYSSLIDAENSVQH